VRKICIGVETTWLCSSTSSCPSDVLLALLLASQRHQLPEGEYRRLELCVGEAGCAGEAIHTQLARESPCSRSSSTGACHRFLYHERLRRTSHSMSRRLIFRFIGRFVPQSFTRSLSRGPRRGPDSSLQSLAGYSLGFREHVRCRGACGQGKQASLARLPQPGASQTDGTRRDACTSLSAGRGNRPGLSRGRSRARRDCRGRCRASLSSGF
jgi:hypothetical protein